MTCWWTISEHSLLDAFQRIAKGESPDMVYAELYANSDHEYMEESNAEEA